MSDDWSADINVVSGALKLWFRELPEPLLTYGLYHLFIDAARKFSDCLLFSIACPLSKVNRIGKRRICSNRSVIWRSLD